MPGEILDNRGRGSAGFTWPAIHPEGRKFGAIAAALCLAGVLLGGSLLGWPLAVLTLGVLAFFRDPERVTPRDDSMIVAPADGLVTQIRTVVPPREMTADDGSGRPALADGPVTRISIFMSVFDVHVNRTPIGGTIRRVVYIPGKFLNADLDKASDDNERNSLVISTPAGRIGVIQIAGLVARRIVSFVKEGQVLGAGERFGLIRFGSRLDVFLPEGAKALVSEGQTAIAGETVLADFKLGDGGRSYRVD